ncbi:hypothetical protein CZ787_17860 [Halomonas citrativorans]|uniref:Uncharacterized protein n=1 Tax=Halomonas citrativorans TaxID=2742612 RepID=A0A1R4I5F0_9GAMM|nr:hypothetical protein [Halomonas citrativorans]SJN14979.1 hypothetical protein CZ787_17860 [Halomonas citrativorans]
MADVVPPAGYNESASNFYQRTGWQDELCLAICLDDARWIVICLELPYKQVKKHFRLLNRE